MIRRFLIVALLASGTSCAGPLPEWHYARDKAAAIRVGMTKDDVTALMGRPNHMFLQTPNGVVEVWAYADGYDDGGTSTAASSYFRIGFDSSGRVVATQVVQQRRRY